MTLLTSAAHAEAKRLLNLVLRMNNPAHANHIVIRIDERNREMWLEMLAAVLKESKNVPG